MANKTQVVRRFVTYKVLPTLLELFIAFLLVAVLIPSLVNERDNLALILAWAAGSAALVYFCWLPFAASKQIKKFVRQFTEAQDESRDHSASSRREVERRPPDL